MMQQDSGTQWRMLLYRQGVIVDKDALEQSCSKSPIFKCFKEMMSVWCLECLEFILVESESFECVLYVLTLSTQMFFTDYHHSGPSAKLFPLWGGISFIQVAVAIALLPWRPMPRWPDSKCIMIKGAPGCHGSALRRSCISRERGPQWLCVLISMCTEHLCT